MKINVDMISAKKGLQKNSQPQGWSQKQIPVFWEFTRRLTQKNSVLAKD